MVAADILLPDVIRDQQQFLCLLLAQDLGRSSDAAPGGCPQSGRLPRLDHRLSVTESELRFPGLLRDGTVFENPRKPPTSTAVPCDGDGLPSGPEPVHRPRGRRQSDSPGYLPVANRKLKRAHCEPTQGQRWGDYRDSRCSGSGRARDALVRDDRRGCGDCRCPGSHLDGAIRQREEQRSRVPAAAMVCEPGGAAIGKLPESYGEGSRRGST